MTAIGLGESVPALTPHAASVSLPTWADNVGYEEGHDRVISKMVTGYPRFFIHLIIRAFSEDIVKKHGRPGQQAMLFPSHTTALRCAKFIRSINQDVAKDEMHIIDLVLHSDAKRSDALRGLSPTISAVIYRKELWPTAKQYWQHTGDGISSRRAEFCHKLFKQSLLVESHEVAVVQIEPPNMTKGPRRYQRASSNAIPVLSSTGPASDGTSSDGSDQDIQESSQFLEERFGRNLDISLVREAGSAIRRRIAGSLTGDEDPGATLNAENDASIRGVAELRENDVYLFSCGMNAIFETHRMMLEARGPLKSISFGFPYVDTLKILEKWGPGCVFYGNGSSADLDDLERRLEAGERLLALFCEFPGNPILSCPDLHRIRQLADRFDFAVVVDETISNLINLHLLPLADVVVSSLTKIFSGECNVMGGSAIFNPRGRYYTALKQTAAASFEDNYWAEDVIYMERNSRHFIPRIHRINHNAEAICDLLLAHPCVKIIFYPKYNATSKANYDACRTAEGGYGGLLSVVFHKQEQAIAFYDTLQTAKGPSLGTNFTLTSPYVLLAHYYELDWAESYGVPRDLLRISVGLEDVEELQASFGEALKAAELV